MKVHLDKAISTMKHKAVKHCKNVHFEVSDMVLIKLQHYKQQAVTSCISNKLACRSMVHSQSQKERVISHIDSSFPRIPKSTMHFTVLFYASTHPTLQTSLQFFSRSSSNCPTMDYFHMRVLIQTCAHQLNVRGGHREI